MLENIELSLLAGDAIPYNDIGYIYPFTLKCIKNIGGELVFNSYLSSLTISKDKLLDEDENEKIIDMTNFELVYTICNMDENFKDTYLKALSFILRQNVIISDSGFSVGDSHDGKLINNSNYDELINIIKLQNCVEKLDNNAYQDNPSSEKARELLEKRRQLREKLNKIKNKDNDNDGEPLTLSDLVSILCANGNGINIFNVWDLSFYAFNNQFNRMKMFEDYQIDIRSVLAGANPNEIQIKHWMSKID